jgi:hypothetical protein
MLSVITLIPHSSVKPIKRGSSELGRRTGIRGRFFIGDEVWEGKGSMLGEMHWAWGIETGRERVASTVLEGGSAECGDERCGEFLGERVHGDAG